MHSKLIFFLSVTFSLFFPGFHIYGNENAEMAPRRKNIFFIFLASGNYRTRYSFLFTNLYTNKNFRGGSTLIPHFHDYNNAYSEHLNFSTNN